MPNQRQNYGRGRGRGRGRNRKQGNWKRKRGNNNNKQRVNVKHNASDFAKIDSLWNELTTALEVSQPIIKLGGTINAEVERLVNKVVKATGLELLKKRYFRENTHPLSKHTSAKFLTRFLGLLGANLGEAIDGTDWKHIFDVRADHYMAPIRDRLKNFTQDRGDWQHATVAQKAALRKLRWQIIMGTIEAVIRHSCSGDFLMKLGRTSTRHFTSKFVVYDFANPGPMWELFGSWLKVAACENTHPDDPLKLVLHTARKKYLNDGADDKLQTFVKTLTTVLRGFKDQTLMGLELVKEAIDQPFEETYRAWHPTVEETEDRYIPVADLARDRLVTALDTAMDHEAHHRTYLLLANSGFLPPKAVQALKSKKCILTWNKPKGQWKSFDLDRLHECLMSETLPGWAKEVRTAITEAIRNFDSPSTAAALVPQKKRKFEDKFHTTNQQPRTDSHTATADSSSPSSSSSSSSANVTMTAMPAKAMKAPLKCSRCGRTNHVVRDCHFSSKDYCSRCRGHHTPHGPCKCGKCGYYHSGRCSRRSKPKNFQ